MRQRRGRSGFTTQPLATTRIAADLRKERLDRDAARQTRVLGEVDGTHTAAADLLADDVRTDQTAVERRTLIVHQQIGRRFEDWSFDEVERTVVRREEGRDLCTQCGIAGTCFVEIGVALVASALDSGVEHVACSGPCVRIQGPPRGQGLARATPWPASNGA